VSPVFHGSDNDKNIARVDPAIKRLRHGDFSKLTWQRYGRDGELYTETGFYFIVDGGYFTWKELISPFSHLRQKGTELDRWSELVESLRKDVECTFGILKKRFMCLKQPLCVHRKNEIENIFNTCCILHNMLLTLDGWDNWEINRGARLLLPDNIEALSDTHIIEEGANMPFVGRPNKLGRKVVRREQLDFENRRQSLSDHYHIFCSIEHN